MKAVAMKVSTALRCMRVQSGKWRRGGGETEKGSSFSNTRVQEFNHRHLLSTCCVTYMGLWEKENEFLLQNKCKSVLPKANITAHVISIM